MFMFCVVRMNLISLRARCQFATIMGALHWH